MRFRKYDFIALLFFLLSFKSFTQTEKDISIIEQRIEFLSESLALETVDLTNLIQVLNDYLVNPLNLNRASKEELESLMLLNEFQIQKLMEHRLLNGDLLSIYELQSVELWDDQTIQMILPFVEVSEKLNQPSYKLKDVFKYGKTEFYSRLQTTIEAKKGYQPIDSLTENSSYQGNKLGVYNRFKFSYRTNFSIGFTTEKDPGEMLRFSNQHKGFDFYSGHLFFKGGKFIESIALGDYQVEIGQGLNVWTGYAFGKTADVLQLKKTATPIRAYNSVDEARFMRGGAINLKFKRFSCLTFFSHKAIDGSLESDSLNDDYFSSITQNGLHRTDNEISRKHQLKETLFGNDLKFQKGGFELGLSNVIQRYDSPLLKDTLPYNQFDFRGQQLLNTSLHYSWLYRNIMLFGELVPKLDWNDAGIIQGLLVSLDHKSNLTLLYRYYGRSFHSFYNNAFSNGSKAQNETGFFIGYTNKINSNWNMNAYIDVMQFPWLKYQVNAPSKGYDYLFQMNYKPNKKVECYVRFRERLKEQNRVDGSDAFTNLDEKRQQNIRFHFSSKVSEVLKINARVEYIRLLSEGFKPETGVLLYQDVIIKPVNSPLKITMRYALFETASYETRVYAFENNVVGVYNVPSFYGKGSKVYGLIQYTLFKHLDCWLKIGRTIYQNQDKIGSGLEEVSGKIKTDITCQIRFKF